jgi:hypothetical protein
MKEDGVHATNSTKVGCKKHPSVQCSSVQSSSVQFSSERTNRAVAKFGREEVSNGGEEKCNSPFLVV